MKEGSKVKNKIFDAFVMWRFLGLGQRLTCIARHIFFLLIWILTGILYHNFSFTTLIEIWILLNLYWENVLLFIFLLEFLNLQHFFMVVSSYIPSLKHELKSKEIKTFVFFPRVLTWPVCISNIFLKMDSTHTTLSLFFTWFFHSIFS